MNKNLWVTLAVILFVAGVYRYAGDTSGQSAQSLHSGLLLENIDTSVRPQDDFFRFVNGKWLQRTEIPADKSNYGSFTALSDAAREDVKAIIEEASAGAGDDVQAAKLGDLYNSFMNEELLEDKGLQPLQPLLDSIDSLQDHAALTDYLAQALRNGTSAPLYFWINTDSKQPDRYLPYLNQSGLGLPDRDFYFREDEKSASIRDAYVTHIDTMFSLAGLDDASPGATVLALESRIAEGHWTRVESRNRDKTYNLHTVQSLADLAPGFDWQRYLQGTGLGSETEVVVRHPSYVTHFAALYNDTPLAQWKTWARWKAVSRASSYLNKALDQEDFNFYGKVLRGTEQQEVRWKRAVSLVNGVLGEQVGQVYVAKHFPPQAKERMVQMVENLREAYREGIQGLQWMGEETKLKAIDKLDKFRPKIGYPDKWKDYSGLDIKADDLFGNVQRATRFEYDREVAKLGGPVDRDEWFMTPQTVNAYYNPGMNEIVFPAAILQPPFFDLHADDAVNYGGIGAVIGHEMGHGFDDQGAKSDGDGVLQNWWTEQDLDQFKARTGQLADQYDKFTVLDGEQVNGKLTLGENIGDLGGLTIAYKAYQLSQRDNPAPVLDGYTGEQRFFFGWGQVWARKYRDEELLQRLVTDPHSPSEFRTNGTISNMPQFYSAFDVKEGDKLYLPPEQRVKIW